MKRQKYPQIKMRYYNLFINKGIFIKLLKNSFILLLLLSLKSHPQIY